MNNGRNSRALVPSQSHDPIIWESRLPEVYLPSDLLDELIESDERMEGATIAAKAAMKRAAIFHIDSTVEVSLAVEKTERLRQICAEDNALTPKMEELIDSSTEDLVATARAIQQALYINLARETENTCRKMATRKRKRSLVEKLEDVLTHEFDIRFRLFEQPDDRRRR